MENLLEKKLAKRLTKALRNKLKALDEQKLMELLIEVGIATSPGDVRQALEQALNPR